MADLEEIRREVAAEKRGDPRFRTAEAIDAEVKARYEAVLAQGEGKEPDDVLWTYWLNAPTFRGNEFAGRRRDDGDWENSPFGGMQHGFYNFVAALYETNRLRERGATEAELNEHFYAAMGVAEPRGVRRLFEKVMSRMKPRPEASASMALSVGQSFDLPAFILRLVGIESGAVT